MFKDVVDRRHTNAVKWEDGVSETGSENAIMLSVADMEFRAPEAVINKLVDASHHGIYGYTGIYRNYLKAVKRWMKRGYDWDVEEDWIVYCPRVSQAVSLIIQNYTAEHDRVLIQTPLYSPLRDAIELNNREVVANPLIHTDQGYDIDFIDLEAKLAKDVKIMILCSPHNPIGRVWTKKELTHIAELCVTYDVLLISDEVHADFTFNQPHIPVQHVVKSMENIIVCTSPAKTFNLPGLFIANIIIPDQMLRETFQMYLKQAGINNPPYYAVPALEEAYLHSDEWLIKLKETILENHDYIKEHLQKNGSTIYVPPIDGTYLMWLDVRSLSVSESVLKDLFVKEAKVVVSFGSSFGEDGEGFIRINLATPKKIFAEALERIVKVLIKHRLVGGN